MTILTLNIWDLPFITKDKRVRMERFFVGTKTVKPDIVCLQEAWEPHIRRRLRLELSDYRIPEWSLGSRLFGFFDRTGGLVTFTNASMEIRDQQFFSFHQNGRFCFEDWIGKKGFLVSRIALGGTVLTLVNVHLHVRILGPESHQIEVRKRQFGEILRMVQNERNVLVVGDFNSEPGDEAIKEVLDSGFDDVTSGLNQDFMSRSNPYSASYFNRLLERRGKLDYVFVKKGCSFQVVNPQIVFTNPPVSDHYGILVEMVEIV